MSETDPPSDPEVPSDAGGRLTRAAIIDAAIDLADSDGFNALSMRKIADRLGVGAMSLYRHVADKDALLIAMTEEVGRRFPYPHEPYPHEPSPHEPSPHEGDPHEGAPTAESGVDPDDLEVVGGRGWRECVQIAVDVDWALYQRHPWVVLAYSSPRHSMGAASLGCLDWMMAGFAQLGVDRVTAAEMTMTLWSYIQGVALTDVSEEILRTRTDEPGARGDLADLLDGAGVESPPPRVAELRGVGHDNAISDNRLRLDRGVELLCIGFEASAGSS